MPFIPVIEPAAATGDLKAVYDRILKSRGKIANILKVQSLLPDALGAHLDLYLAVQFGNVKGGLSRRERELVAVIVSAANKCEYCVEHHADALGRYMKEPWLLDFVKRDWRITPLPENEHALGVFAERLTRDPNGIRREDIDALRKVGYSDTAILQATLTTAYFNFVNRIALGLGVEVDDVEGAYKY